MKNTLKKETLEKSKINENYSNNTFKDKSNNNLVTVNKELKQFHMNFNSSKFANNILQCLNNFRRSPVEYVKFLQKTKTSIVNNQIVNKDNESIINLSEGPMIIDELISVLSKIRTLEQLIPSSNLNKTAEDFIQVLQMHDSNNTKEDNIFNKNEGFLKRIKQYGIPLGAVGECIEHSDNINIAPEYIILKLLLNDGDKNKRFNRNILLNNKFKYVGIAVDLLPSSQRISTVIELCENYYNFGDKIPLNTSLIMPNNNETANIKSYVKERNILERNSSCIDLNNNIRNNKRSNSELLNTRTNSNVTNNLNNFNEEKRQSITSDNLKIVDNYALEDNHFRLSNFSGNKIYGTNSCQTHKSDIIKRLSKDNLTNSSNSLLNKAQNFRTSTIKRQNFEAKNENVSFILDDANNFKVNKIDTPPQYVGVTNNNFVANKLVNSINNCRLDEYNIDNRGEKYKGTKLTTKPWLFKDIENDDNIDCVNTSSKLISEYPNKIYLVTKRVFYKNGDIEEWVYKD